MPSQNWEETSPADSDLISEGAQRIREHKDAIGERLGVDHNAGTTTAIMDASDVGYHKKLTMQEQASSPTAVADCLIYYTKDVSTVTELFVRLPSGTEIQLTTGGKFDISKLAIASMAEGDLFYASSASAVSRLAKGTASQQLRMNSGATAPEWFTPDFSYTEDTSFPGSPSAGDTFYHTSRNRLYVYNGSDWDVLNPQYGFDENGTQSATSGAALTLASVTMTPQTSKVKITATWSGGSEGTGSTELTRVIRQDTTDISTNDYQADSTYAPQHTPGAIILIVTGLTPGTEYTWDIYSTVNTGNQTYYASALLVEEIDV